MRATCGNSAPETRTGADGKQYPARRPPATEQEAEVDKVKQAAIEADGGGGQD
jgi:hypothetical protein